MNRNILLITSDQQRWDALGALSSRIQTPNLDRLAEDGILFTRGYTVNPVCTPSRCTMLTGQYPSRHGCYHVGTSLPRDYGPTVAHRLADAGYFTALLGKAHFQQCLDPESFESAPGIHDLDYFGSWTGPYYGFEHCQLVIGHTSEPHACGMHYGHWLRSQEVDLKRYFNIHKYSERGNWILPEELHGSAWVADKTIEAVDMAADKPFFLWASFQDPHNPYVVPSPWSELYDPDAMPDPETVENEMASKPPFYQALVDGDFYGNDPGLEPMGRGDVRLESGASNTDVRAVRAAYSGMVSLMDFHIGRIIEALEERNLLSSTLIVFTSDHGDYLGNHGLWGKGLPAYEDIQRVPFMVRHPDCVTPGARSESLQSVVDLEATFCKYSEIPQGYGSQGVDQTASWVDGAKKTRDWTLMEFKPSEGSFLQHTLVTDSHKLVYYRAREYGELYDLKADPNQFENLYDSPDYSEIKSLLLRKLLDAEMEKEGRMRPRTAFA
jgi:arylsulfatase A-like enzyme